MNFLTPAPDTSPDGHARFHGLDICVCIALAFAAFLGFTLAYADLLWLSLAGILPRFLWPFPCVIFPVHAWWTLETLLRGLSHDRIARFRDRYRALFALIGVAMVFTLLFKKGGAQLFARGVSTPLPLHST